MQLVDGPRMQLVDGEVGCNPLLSMEFRTNNRQIYSMFRVEDELIQRLKVDTPMIPNINTTLMDIPEAQTSFKPGLYSKPVVQLFPCKM